ncbi:hypothetical protein [Brevundimonas sp. GCM10030266]|uniref:hypothetical protein n=1 Tax=Brevundimonas sp. GCM10030266 TaxID=3273386 RepID=UPI003608218A
MHEGYQWILRPQDGQWLWRAVTRDGQAVLAEGLARTRAEGAAYLARTMSLASLAADRTAA